MRLFKRNSQLEELAIEEHWADIQALKARNEAGKNVRHAG
jgi:hypothetical protein